MLNVCIKHSVYFMTNHYYAISVMLYLLYYIYIRHSNNKMIWGSKGILPLIYD